MSGRVEAAATRWTQSSTRHAFPRGRREPYLGAAPLVPNDGQAPRPHAALRRGYCFKTFAPLQNWHHSFVSSQPARARARRKADALVMLATPAVDVWVATASPSNVPHLVPLSLAWVDERAVIAVEGGSVTQRNLSASGRARLAIGPTRDVVMIDATLEATLAVEADTALAAAYVSQADWDPRLSSGYMFLVLRPVRVQAWREANEIEGRTIMQDGAWLV